MHQHQPPTQPVSHERTIDRRALLAGATALAGSGIAVAVGTRGSAQEAQWLNPGPATPHALGPAIPPEVEQHADDWPVPTGNYAAHRANPASAINASNIAQLEIAWTWPIDVSGAYGGMTATPVVIGETIYVQDQNSNVFAIHRDSGETKWARRYEMSTIGPNGPAVGYGLVYACLGPTAEFVALDAETGEEVWRVDLSDNDNVGIDMAPTVYDNVVYVSTVPGTQEAFYEGGQKGILYALDAKTGTELWEFDTTTDNLWGMPRVNSGGGLWYPLSVDDEGNIYFGVGNPGPWPGIVAFGTPFPNGSSRPGPNDFTNSMVSLDTTTGTVRWYHNAKPHDLFDLDFQNTPVIANVAREGVDVKMAIGSGKTGTVVAADAETGAVLWETEVGRHLNDRLQEIPEGETIEVWPGSLGGVETPIAYANGTVFVPVVNLPSTYTALEQGGLAPFNEATGEFVALNAADGTVKWSVDLPMMALAGAGVADGVVFSGTMDGRFVAYDTETGEELWRYQARAGFNAPMAIAGDMVVVPAAGPLLQPSGATATPMADGDAVRSALIAFRLGGGVATPTAG